MKKVTKKQKGIKQIIKKQITRVELTKKSHLWFFYTYFSDHVRYKIADFHKEMFAISEDESIKFATICSFRGSGKSTLMTLSFPLWAILGKMQSKFVVIISQTQDQAKLHFKNLRHELETNELLKRDLGPFKQLDEWGSCSLIIPKYNAKIIAVSREQSFRGIRHSQYRPSLIVADDVENSESVRKQESRDKTYDWFTTEVLPLGDKDTKIILVGNLLHKNSLIKRIENEIATKQRSGIYRRYPIVDSRNRILWPGKYPTMNDIDIEKKKVGNKFAWLKEYMLVIVDDYEPIIEKEWIHYYQELPNILTNQSFAFAGGVDLAVSENSRADLTAIVTCKIIGSGDEQKIYILSNPINTKMTLPVTLDSIMTLAESFGKNVNYIFYIEEAGQQMGVTQLLESKKIKAFGVGVGGKDKVTRLSIVSELIRSGKIVFPYKGAKKLIEQMLNLGLEPKDDLVDAFTTLIIGIMKKPPITSAEVEFIRSVNMWPTISLGDGSDEDDEDIFDIFPRARTGKIVPDTVKCGIDGLPIRKD